MRFYLRTHRCSAAILTIPIVASGACGGGSGPSDPSGDIPGLSLATTAVTVAAGATATAPVTIERVNFSGMVSLSVSGMPAGVTASIEPQSTTGTEATLTINAGVSATIGSHTLTVAASAAGAPDATANLALVIAAYVGPSTFKAVSVAGGDGHTCAIGLDGTAYCWGLGSDFQLGTGEGSDEPFPAAVAGDREFTSVSAGDGDSCAITAHGSAHCWGKNLQGRLGDGTTDNRLVPTPVTGSLQFTQIVPYMQATCGLSTSGEVYCWGDTRDIVDILAVSPVPLLAARGATFDRIALGVHHTCGLGNDGVVSCWGRAAPYLEAVGNGGLARDDVYAPTPVTGSHVFRDLDAGYAHNCALTVAGRAYCWGWNLYGQLGDGTREPRQIPVEVDADLTFESIAAGGTSTCALTTEGKAYCWGQGVMFAITESPVAVGSDVTFMKLTVGENHACGVTVDNSTYCWGRNWSGELGDGNGGASSFSPVPVPVGDSP